MAGARDVFKRFGYRKTALSDIASEAGVSKATVYQYFDGKDALFGAVVKEYYEDYVQRLKSELLQENNVVDKLRRYALVLLEQHKQAVDSFENVEELMEQFPFVVKHIMRIRQLELDVVGDMVREAVEQGQFRADLNVESVTAMLFGVFRAMIGAVCSSPGTEAVVDDFLDVLLHGLMRERTSEVV